MTLVKKEDWAATEWNNRVVAPNEKWVIIHGKQKPEKYSIVLSEYKDIEGFEYLGTGTVVKVVFNGTIYNRNHISKEDKSRHFYRRIKNG